MVQSVVLTKLRAIFQIKISMLFALVWVLLAPLGALADDMPSFIGGKSFKGLMSQFNREEFEVEFQFTNIIDPGQPSKVNYIGIGCTSNLIPVEVGENQVLFKARVTKGNCLDHGYILVEDNAIMNMPVAYYSPLRTTYPRSNRALLFDVQQPVPSIDEMKKHTIKYLGHPQRILWGSWLMMDRGYEYAYAPGIASCDQAMPREGYPWLPFYAKGDFVIWPQTSKDGGNLFIAAPEEPFSKKLVVNELKHIFEETFIAEGGLRQGDKQIIFTPMRDDYRNPDRFNMEIEDKNGGRKLYTIQRCANSISPPPAQ